MKATTVITTAFLLTATAACSTEPFGPDLPGDQPHTVDRGTIAPVDPGKHRSSDGKPMAISAQAPAGASGWETVDVVSFENTTRAVGRSRMDREAGRVNVNFWAGELARGEATTLWAVVFNNPEACVGECDDPDLFENPATQPDLLYMAGAVADGEGRVRYAASVREGMVSESIMPLFGLPAWGVIDTDQAEIHLIVRSHGPAIAGLRTAQTTTFNGGCTGFGSEFGTPGPNECVDLYFSSHYAN